MQIELTPDQSSFVELGIQQGRFRSREDAVRAALALWEQRERARIELLASLDAAEKSLDVGEGEVYSVDQLGSLVESIKTRGEARLADR